MKIGIDIEEVARFDKCIKNAVYLKRIFSKEEIKYCLSKANPAQSLAARFAAKEAVWKALNNDKIVIFDISIKNAKDGKPQVYIKGKKQNKIDISLSHTKQYAAAAAIVSAK
ncbi:MAG: holo-ACP synthase [Elusimicrobiota bacterium]|jgi:holo-[acyl-carrier protein] synthase|nr:holo-ACP synthase [Elusimicrobiota bacterium]